MSEDRFKQARRSLIDRHNQRHQQDQNQGQGETFDDDFEDEATALVNLDAPQQPPPFAPPPNFEEEEEDDATELFSVDQNFEAPPPQGGVQMRTHSGVQPSYDNFREDQGGQQQQQQWDQGGQQQQQQWDQGGQQQQWDQGGQQQQWDQGGQQGYEPPPTDTGHDISQANPNQSLVIGGSEASEFDGNTQFVNLSDFAAGKSFTPDNQAAGYEGSTQFVDLNALQAGAAAEASGQPPPVQNDPVLRQSYQFGPESIQQGEFTLIFAQNAAGRPVILKRIWEGDPNKMPMPVRQRVAALDQIRHPRLIALNGMIASQSGAWVELNRPPGYRLTDIIQQNGPQEPETVTGWMKQAAEVLTAVHQQGFVYANMTPDAVWVQDDGTVLLEPFDILAFEHRGDLGAFGPPEMNFPPEQRQLYPATDIYSLAAVTLAGLTGLPLNPGAVESLDKKLSNALLDALTENPQERPQSAQEFADSLDKSGGGGLDMKFVIIAVAVLGVAALGTVYYLQQQKKPGPKKGPDTVVAAKEKPPADQPEDSTGTEKAALPANADSEGGEAGRGPGEAGEAAPSATGDLDAPPIEQDPRLNVKTSLRINPLPNAEQVREEEVDPEQAAAARADAREILDGIEKLVPDQQRENYAAAMAKAAEAIRLSGGEPTEADQQLLEDLFDVAIVQEIQEDYFKRVNKSLRDEKLSRVKSIYPKLAAVDASADEFKFFNQNKSVGIKKLERADSPSTDDEETEDSEE